MVEESPEEARQGRRGKPVAVILLVSLALGLLALIALVMWAIPGDEPGPEPAETGQAPTIQAPARLG